MSVNNCVCPFSKLKEELSSFKATLSSFFPSFLKPAIALSLCVVGLFYIYLGWAWDKKKKKKFFVILAVWLPIFWPPLPLLTLDMGHCSADCSVRLLLCFHVCRQIEGSIEEGTVLLHNHIKFNDGGVIFDNLPPSTSFWSHTAWKARPHSETWIYRQVLEDYGPIWVVLWSCQGPAINQKIGWTASPSKSASYMS